MLPLPAETTTWLATVPGMPGTPQPLFADASFRSYYRVPFDKPQQGINSLVLMHAPPEKESLPEFISLARQWRRQGVHTPRIYRVHQQLGLLLIEDFGDVHLAQATDIQGWYLLAFEQLLCIQATDASGLPDFIDSIFAAEMRLLPQWGRHYGINPEPRNWRALCDKLGQMLGAMPQLACHRDFHCRNLMCLGNTPDSGVIGVLDFQDACLGPAGYDLASLLFDAYTELQEPVANILITQQARSLEMAESEFRHQLYLVAMQRLLKVYGIFCRLAKRDNKLHYLDCLPRISNYLLGIAHALVRSGESWLVDHMDLIQSLTDRSAALEK